jgi:isopropylmalate/homocitrate/citramalate synthase
MAKWIPELLEGVDHSALENEFDPEGRWWLPYTNGLEVVREGMRLPKRVTIFDQTLREGTHTPGRKNLSVEDRLRVLEALVAAGIREAEIGSYSYGSHEEKDSVREAKARGLDVRLSMHSAGWVQDFKSEVDKLAECGIDMINFILFGTVAELASTPWLRPEDLPQRSADLVEYGKSQGLIVGFGLTSTGRSHPLVEEECYRAATAAGADRVYLYDGFGVMIPEVVRYCMRRLRDIVGPEMELAFHGHNDFGLSLANSVAAVQSGCTVLDATVNGLGNRVGIASLEELAATLTVLYGVDAGIDISKLGELSSLVEELYGIPVPHGKPVIGRNMYWHESDAHNSAILAGRWYSWNVIRPEAIGRKNVINVVPQSLHKQPQGTIASKLRSLDVTATDEQFDQILLELEAVMNAKERAVASEQELEDVIANVVGAHAAE